MVSRLKHFRASFLLVFSTAALYWVISFWLPLPTYLAAMAGDKYADYHSLIQLIVGLYLGGALVNLILAGVLATRISSRLKFWLALSPAIIIFLVPLLAVIPVAMKFPERNYFEVFQAMFRLFRFTKPDTFAQALLFTLAAVGLNIWAALMIRNSDDNGKLSSSLRNRYLIYTSSVVVIIGVFVAFTTVGSMQRSMDRQSCYDYKALELPILDKDYPIFFNNITLAGEQAGTAQMSNAFKNFADISRQYYAMLDSSADQATLDQYQVMVATAKTVVEDRCSEFSTD